VALLVLSAAALAAVLRNIFGAPSQRGIVAGRISMVVFAGLAAFFFWTAQEGKTSGVRPEAIIAAQRVMIGCLLALVLSAYSVGAQRRRLRAQAAAGKPQPPPS
jgi:hypothetical protein